MRVLEKLLGHWEQDNFGTVEAEAKSLGVALDAQRLEGTRHVAKMMADLGPPLPLFLEDNSHRTAGELAEIAAVEGHSPPESFENGLAMVRRH